MVILLLVIGAACCRFSDNGRSNTSHWQYFASSHGSLNIMAMSSSKPGLLWNNNLLHIQSACNWKYIVDELCTPIVWKHPMFAFLLKMIPSCRKACLSVWACTFKIGEFCTKFKFISSLNGDTNYITVISPILLRKIRTCTTQQPSAIYLWV